MKDKPPIPASLMSEFVGYTDYAYKSDLPDGGWFQMLVDDATRFMEEHHLRGDPTSAVNQMLRYRTRTLCEGA